MIKLLWKYYFFTFKRLSIKEVAPFTNGKDSSDHNLLHLSQTKQKNITPVTTNDRNIP